MVKPLYESFQCAVAKDGEESDWFQVITGVKQGFTMSGFLFIMVIDFIMKRNTDRETTGIKCSFIINLKYLNFAHDLTLLS